MPSITVLGAGAMGSGLTRPLVDSGWDVRLWGTWLDDHLIDAIEAGTPHPRINVVISDKVRTYRSDRLEDSCRGLERGPLPSPVRLGRGPIVDLPHRA